MTHNIGLIFNIISVIIDMFQEYSKGVYGETTLETYFRNYIKNQYFSSKKIGVNEPRIVLVTRNLKNVVIDNHFIINIC